MDVNSTCGTYAVMARTFLTEFTTYFTEYVGGRATSRHRIFLKELLSWDGWEFYRKNRAAGNYI